MARTTIAFLVAPLAAPVLMVPYLYFAGATPELFVFAIQISFVFSYGGSFTIGLPAYLFFRSRGSTSYWMALLVGFLAGATTWLIFSIVFALLLGNGMRGVELALTDLSTLRGAIWPGGLAGACVGLVFWLIARPDRHNQ